MTVTCNYDNSTELIAMASSPSDAADFQDKHLLPNVVLSIVTGPFLLGLISARMAAESLTQLGQASEEFFRGERLPSLTTFFSSEGAPEESSDT